MKTVISALTASRAAHRQGRALMAKGQSVAARAQFTIALKARLAARALDPTHTDPVWADDLKALHSRREFDRDLGQRLVKQSENDPDPEGYDVPSQRVATDLGQADRELEAYFQHQLGQSANTHSQVDVNTVGAVLPPDTWVTFSDGVTLCATCTHPEADHDEVEGCKVASFQGDGIVECDCEAYVPLTCRHIWVPSSPVQRTCKACGEVQQLRPTIAVEDTLAFKQLQQEAQGKSVTVTIAIRPYSFPECIKGTCLYSYTDACKKAEDETNDQDQEIHTKASPVKWRDGGTKP